MRHTWGYHHRIASHLAVTHQSLRKRLLGHRIRWPSSLDQGVWAQPVDSPAEEALEPL